MDSLSSISKLSRPLVSASRVHLNFRRTAGASALKSGPEGFLLPSLSFLFALHRLCAPLLDILALLGQDCLSSGSFSCEESTLGGVAPFCGLAVRVATR